MKRPWDLQSKDRASVYKILRESGRTKKTGEKAPGTFKTSEELSRGEEAVWQSEASV